MDNVNGRIDNNTALSSTKKTDEKGQIETKSSKDDNNGPPPPPPIGLIELVCYE